MLDNREIATLILIGVGVTLVLVLPKVRPAVASSAADVLRIAFTPKILAVFGLFFVWCGACIVLASRLDLWEIDLLKDSVLIVLTVGFPVLFTVIKAKSGAEILRKIVGETVALSALLAFYLNLESFTIPGELALQLALLVIVLMSAGASITPDGTRLAGCLNVLLAVLGLGLVAWTTSRLVITASERDWGATWMELALSVWLPLSMFGFFYGLAFFAAVEMAVMRMRRIFEPPARRRVIVAAVLGLHLRVRWAAAFTGTYQQQVARSATFRAGLTAMRAFRQHVSELETREQERQERLTAMAGEPGTDGDGAQLD